ncbi:uncharacterized protein LOC110701090 [Chenopodium quinoa]|uniref:uncharacterized protein LOC110701090 n=1 Tax=Chenopodium quinoa TaxID=63459 RepID=UPI000B772A2C|nr:uncharacterized protein LOC110701090 [Chenopodium quinoa]
MVDQAKNLDDYISSSDKMFHGLLNHEKMLENHIVQLANPLKYCASPSSLPSQEIDPKEPVCSITTRSGKFLEESVPRKSKEGEEGSDSSKENKHEESSKMSKKSNKEQKEKEKKKDEVYKPKLPYPQKFNRYKLDEQFGQCFKEIEGVVVHEGSGGDYLVPLGTWMFEGDGDQECSSIKDSMIDFHAHIGNVRPCVEGVATPLPISHTPFS